MGVNSLAFFAKRLIEASVDIQDKMKEKAKRWVKTFIRRRMSRLRLQENTNPLKIDHTFKGVIEFTGMFYGCSKFSEVYMPASMNGIYDTSKHGDIGKTVIYDL